MDARKRLSSTNVILCAASGAGASALSPGRLEANHRLDTGINDVVMARDIE